MCIWRSETEHWVLATSINFPGFFSWPLWSPGLYHGTSKMCSDWHHNLSITSGSYPHTLGEDLDFLKCTCWCRVSWSGTLAFRQPYNDCWVEPLSVKLYASMQKLCLERPGWDHSMAPGVSHYTTTSQNMHKRNQSQILAATYLSGHRSCVISSCIAETGSGICKQNIPRRARSSMVWLSTKHK